MQKSKHSKIKMLIQCILVLVITIIGSYGIVTAPKPDSEQLKRELEANALSLELADAATIAGAGAPEMGALPESDSLFGESTQQEMAALPGQSTLSDSAALPKQNILPEQSASSELSALSGQSAAAHSSMQPERSISVIGDSVFLGAAPSYRKLEMNVVIDAKISRQVYQGLDVAKKLQKKGKLGDTVLISLGTNGKFNEATGQELIDYLGTERTIYWITAYGKNLSWQKEVNQTIADLVRKNSNVYLIPWAKEAKKHDDWFYQDGTHLNTKGQEGFAKFIVKETEKTPSA